MGASKKRIFFGLVFLLGAPAIPAEEESLELQEMARLAPTHQFDLEMQEIEDHFSQLNLKPATVTVDEVTGKQAGVEKKAEQTPAASPLFNDEDLARLNELEKQSGALPPKKKRSHLKTSP